MMPHYTLTLTGRMAFGLAATIFTFGIVAGWLAR